MHPLFEQFPPLLKAFPHLPLASLPTPVRPLDSLGAAWGGASLWLKDDSVSGPLYGGNKVRKLEFLLGRAQACGARGVVTFGAAGSNHALATAIYARHAGFEAMSILGPQANASFVRKNLLRHGASGARMEHLSYTSSQVAALIGGFMRRHREQHGVFPHVIPVGGSSPVGCLGFVNAGLELARQVEAGQLPKPGRVYVAAGTLGTSVGLSIGLGAAGMNTRVVAVRVTKPPFCSEAKARALHEGTMALLQQGDPSFPGTAFSKAPFEIRDGFLGEEYAVFTPEGVEAIRQMRELEGCELEPTYTGKALAALEADARGGLLDDAPTLFWNTFSSVHPQSIAPGAYTSLPAALHPYFENPVQPLDPGA